MHPKKQ